MSDRYHIDEETQARRLESAHGAIDMIPEDEETQKAYEEGNVAYVHSRTRSSEDRVLGRSGSIDAVDDLFNNPESADAEMVSLADDFLQEKYKVGYSSEYGLAVKDKDSETVKEEFREWLNKEQFGESEGGFGVLISRGNIDTKPEVREKLNKMSEMWTDPKTSVNYKVSEGSEDEDVLEFKNGDKQVSIKVDELNSHLSTQVTGKFADAVRVRVRRPWRGRNSDIYANSLKALNFGDGVFAGQKITAEFPNKKTEKRNPNEVKSNEHSFDLNVDLTQLKHDHGNEGQDFFGTWIHHGQDEIKSLSFVVENDAITKVVLNLNVAGDNDKFDSAEISTELFLKAFNKSVEPYESTSGGVVGLKFKRKDGREFTIGPKTPSKSAERTMSNVRINGTALPKDLPVFVVQKAKESNSKKAGEESENTSSDYLIKPREAAIERQIDDQQKEWVNKFIEAWKSGKVTKVEVDTKKGAISALKLFTEGSDKGIFLSRTIFHAVFDGVKLFRGHPLESDTGLVFVNGGKEASLTPETTDTEAKDILSHVSLDGVKLSDTVTVSVNLPKTASINEY